MNKTLATAGIIIIALLGGIYAWQKSSSPAGIACTADAQLCPDGSAVGRTGPKCEFAPCPADSSTWKQFTDAETGISFRYPEALTTKYIDAFEWPPKLQLTFKPFTCTETGSEITPAGKTEKRTVDSQTYCVTRAAGAAAGSTYTEYSYALPTDSGAITFSFTIRTVQCGNYGEPEKTECEIEQTSFDLDGLVDRIVKSVAIAE